MNAYPHPHTLSKDAERGHSTGADAYLVLLIWNYLITMEASNIMLELRFFFRMTLHIEFVAATAAAVSSS